MAIEPIQRIDQRLRELPKPRLHVLDNSSIENYDTLIVTSGFEDRALGVLKRIAETGKGKPMVVSIDYKPFKSENRANEITDLCKRHGIEKISLVYDRYNPESIGESLLSLLENRKGKISIDISAMSRLLVVQIVVEIGRFGLLNKTSILYTEAREYPPTEDEFHKMEKEAESADMELRQFFLSSGVYDVRILPELSSISQQGQSVRLVTFPSFNVDQLASLRGEIQPYNINLIHGRSPRPECAWRTEAIRKFNQVDHIPEANRIEKETSTFDYRETLVYLLEVYESHGAWERIFVAPTGSKMQTVAVGVFRAFMKDVQVVYPIPRKLEAKRYTIGVEKTYSLDLSPFAPLLEGRE